MCCWEWPELGMEKELDVYEYGKKKKRTTQSMYHIYGQTIVECWQQQDDETEEKEVLLGRKKEEEEEKQHQANGSKCSNRRMDGRTRYGK